MKIYKYGDNVDTDVIIPARHLNDPDPKVLASHCMEDIDKDFSRTVEKGDIMVGGGQLWLRLQPGTCPSGHQVQRDQVCHCQELRSDFLPQCYQHRFAHSGMPGGRRGDPVGGYGERGLRYRRYHRRDPGKELVFRAPARIY